MSLAAAQAAVPVAEGERRVSASRLLALSLWLGIVGFGGGFAVAQRIRRTVVEEKRWMSEAVFLEMFAVASALPGTTATNLLTMIGLRLGRWKGGPVCALGFLLPSIALMIVLGMEYEHVRSIALLGRFLDGMSYATVGVVAAVALDMGRSAVKTRGQLAIAVAAAGALSFGLVNLLEVMALAGLLGAFAFRRPSGPSGPPGPDGPAPTDEGFPPASSTLASVLLPPALVMASTSFALFFVFARIGVATFGGGFAMIPPIEHEVVSVRGWLTESAFNDAMVLGQVTPGPVAIAATFIGYRVQGLAGALLATLGMFGPPFALSVIAAHSHAAFRTNVVVQGFLRGVSPAVVGVIVAAAVALSRTSVHGILGGAVAAAVFAVLGRFPRLTPLLPLACGGLLNALVRSR